MSSGVLDLNGPASRVNSQPVGAGRFPAELPAIERL
jgi:hypothetical protein